MADLHAQLALLAAVPLVSLLVAFASAPLRAVGGRRGAVIAPRRG